MQHILKIEDWVKNYGDYLFGVAYYKTNNKELAEDLVQDAFVSAIKAKETYNGTANEKTWLATILKNKIIDHYRKQANATNYQQYLQSTQTSFSKNYFVANGEQEGHVKIEAFSNTWSNADAVVNEKDFSHVLQQCLTKLPNTILPIFLRKFVDEAKADAICKEFNITNANYWVIIHRAKLVLKTCLEKNWMLAIK
jgi:RNA polymerase sigma-70 factor (TIGR02943 family)